VIEMVKVCLICIVGFVSSSVALAQEASSKLLQEKPVLPQRVEPLGIWSWEQRGGTNTLELKLDAGTWTAKVQSSFGNRGGGNAGQRLGGGANVPVVKNITLEGDKVAFDVERRLGETVFVTSYAGVISGDEIAGVAATNFGGQVRESAWMAKRTSPPSIVAANPTEQPTQKTDTAQTSTDLQAASASASDPSATNAPESKKALSDIPKPSWIPDAGEATGEPYQPRPILPGGIVMTLYSPTSPHLKTDRVNEVEKYSLSDSVHGRINSIVNIHNPSIEVHFASPSMNTGAVIILAAGGGHRTLNVGTESADFVPYFFNFGVNTVILRNRLRSDGYEPTTDAVRDAFQAIRLVRKHAETWKFDPKRIGIMGFSAGAELSARTAVQFEQFDKDNNESNDPLAGISSRPDFVGVIYPGPSPFTANPETPIPRNTPPSFITCPGAGDRVHAKWATDYFSAMLDVGIPNVEMHIYGNGRHPGDRGMTGGLTFRQGIPFGKWQDRYIEWFDDLGFLSATGTVTKAAAESQEYESRVPR
jgi:acetyl esterase/lipase